MAPRTSESIKLSMSTTSPSYRVGETVTAVLHAISAEDVWTDLQDLEIVLAGVERVDTAWVSSNYRKKISPINDDKRRVQRLVLRSRLQAATQGNFSDADFRRFVIRLTLPNWLPPSYKGTAVRYSYYLEAVLRYKKDGTDAPVPADYQEGSFPAAASDVPASTQLAVTTVRLPLLLWPDKEKYVLPDGGSSGDVFPSVNDNVPIKCWEIGPGTAIDDAIQHISSIGTAVSGSSVPHTPSFIHREDSTNNNHRADASETASEISHEETTHNNALRQQGSSSSGVLRTPSLRVSRQTSSALSDRLDSDDKGGAIAAALQAEAAAAAATTTSGEYKSYWLRMGDHPVARVSLHPPLEGHIGPGSTVGGTIEYPSHCMDGHIPGILPQTDSHIGGGTDGTGSEKSPRCVQLSLLLESEESVVSTWRAPTKNGAMPLRKLHDEHFEVTSDLASTSFLFTLPLDATPSFQTSLLSLKWQLRFQFGVDVGGGKQEVLTWCLPISVESPN